MLYLDHAATTPVRAEVRDAVAPFLAGAFGNPSSHHIVGERAAAVLDDARARVARVLGMRAGDIVFVSGGTEANNLAVKGITLASGRSRIVTTAIEHDSVRASAAYLAERFGMMVDMAPVDATGRVDLAALAALVTDETALVSIGYANNEIGTVQDVEAISGITRAARVPLHLDAVQAAGWLPLAGTGADALSIAGHKIGAGGGTGVLAVRGRVPVEPLMHGGGQERGRRSGTESLAGVVAFTTALELAAHDAAAATARIAPLRDAFIARVLDLVPSARLTGHPTARLAGHASFTFAGTSGEAVLLELERRGVVSSSGSACAAGSDEPSPVLLAVGVEPAVAQTAVRLTLPTSFDGSLLPVADALAAAVAAVQSGA